MSFSSVTPIRSIMLEPIIAICLGIGLAAACGFRIFVPMLVVSIAAKLFPQWLSVAEGFEWVGSWPAIVCFATASLLEIAAYYIPWLDNALDTVATPAAAIAGVLVTAAFVADMHPLLAWSVPLIAGAPVAGTVKTGMSGVRLGSTTTTAGVANSVVSTVEWISSLAMSILAIVVPILAAIVALVLTALLLRYAYKLYRYWFRRPPATDQVAQ